MSKVVQAAFRFYTVLLSFEHQFLFSYFADITFVIKGEVIGHDNESSMLNSEEISPKEYWDEEKSSALKTKLHAWAAQTAEARAAAEKEGCDTGCEVKP